MSMTRRMAWNTVVKWAEALLGAVVGLAIVPFELAFLGKDGRGLTGIVVTIVTSSLLAQLGMRHSLGRQLAEAIAQCDNRRASELYSTAVVFYVSVAAIVAAVFWLLSAPIVKLMSIPPSLEPQALFLMRYFAPANAFLIFLRPVDGGILIANHRWDLFSYCDMAEIALRAAGVFGVLYFFPAWGLYGWAAAMLLPKLVQVGMFRYFARSVSPELTIQPERCTWQAFHELFTLGGLLFVRENVTLIGQRTDPLVLGYFTNTAAVAAYDPATKVTSSIGPFVHAFMRQITPVATAFHAVGQRETVRELLIRGTRFTFLFGGAVCAVFACFAHPVIRVWLGGVKVLDADWLDATSWALVLWALRDLLHYSSGTQWEVLVGLNRVKFTVWVQFVLAVIHLAAAIVLVWWMWRGGWKIFTVVGVVIPTVVLGVVERVIITVHTARISELALARYLREAYLWPTVVIITLAAVSLVLQFYVDPRTLWPLLACMAVPGLLWFPLSWWVALDVQDRSRLMRLVRKNKQNQQREPQMQTESA